MKRILVVVAALLLVVGLSAVDAQAAGPFCFDFDAFIDGLELSNSGRQVYGTWNNWDGLGGQLPMNGFYFNGPYGLGAYVTAEIPDFGMFAFHIDFPMDGSMVMYYDNGGVWEVWLDPVDYTMYPGPCGFSDGIGSPGLTTIGK